MLNLGAVAIETEITLPKLFAMIWSELVVQACVTICFLAIASEDLL